MKGAGTESDVRTTPAIQVRTISGLGYGGGSGDKSKIPIDFGGCWSQLEEARLV